MITAMYMGIPAGFAISMINFPSSGNNSLPVLPTSRRQPNDQDDKHSEKVTSAYLRVATGSYTGLVSSLIFMAYMIAFISMYAFLDAVLIWLGSRVGLDISIKIVLGYILAPVVYMIGVEWNDCFTVGTLVASKLIKTGEAFAQIPQLVQSNSISVYSGAMATMTILGLSTIGTLALLTATYAALVPCRRTHRLVGIFARLALNLNLTSLYSASIASALTPPEHPFYTEEGGPLGPGLGVFMNMIPGYKDLMAIAGNGE